MGCKGLRARTLEELPEVMAEFLATKEPVIFDAVVCKDEHGKSFYYFCHL